MEVKLRSVSEILDEKPFYPELDRVPFNTLLGSEIVIADAKIMPDFHSTVNGQQIVHDLALLKIGNNGTSFTTAVSASAVVEKVKKLIRRKAIPCTGTPIEEVSESSGNTYYNLK